MLPAQKGVPGARRSEGERRLHCGAGQHALIVIRHLGKLADGHPVALEPACNHEEVDVGQAEALPSTQGPAR